MANANLIGAGAGPAVQVTWGDFETGFVPVANTTSTSTLPCKDFIIPGWEICIGDKENEATATDTEAEQEWLEEQQILREIEFANTQLLPYLRHLENFAELLDMFAKGCNTLCNRARRRNDQHNVRFLTDKRQRYNQLETLVRFEIVRVVRQIDAIDPSILEFDMYDAKREVADLFKRNLIPVDDFDRQCYDIAYSRFLEDLAKGTSE